MFESFVQIFLKSVFDALILFLAFKILSQTELKKEDNTS